MRPLAVIGNVNVDLILGPAEPWPKAGTEIIVDHDELRVGGSAGNAALAWKALGVDFDIAANTGTDEFGRWLRESFGAQAEKWPIRPEGTTLSVGITHPDGERTFFTTRGHLPRFSLDCVFAALDGARLSGGYALLCGSFLTDDLAADYPYLFDWADHHRIYPGARYGLAARRLDRKEPAGDARLAIPLRLRAVERGGIDNTVRSCRPY